MPRQIRGKCRISVFVSGTGTNLQALIDYEQLHPEWPAQIALVVSDKPHCQAVDRARQAGIPVFTKEVKAYPDKNAYEADILRALKEYDVQLIVLAGYMRLIGPILLDAYKNRILNIHPSLLPAFPGRTAVRDALAANVSETGVTVHYVDEGIDTGPIVAQRVVPVEPGMTEPELLARIHAVEHELYPTIIAQVILNG